MAELPRGWDKSDDSTSEEQLLAAMQASEAAPRRDVNLRFDGKIHRYAVAGDKQQEKTGWYIVFDDGIPAGAFGNWRLSFKQNWHANIGRELSYDERISCAMKWKEAARLREEEQRRQHEMAAVAVNKILSEAAPASPEHPYLTRKRVGSYGLYQTGDGRLIMPICLDGKVVSAQYIDGDGKKQFHGGGEVKGGYFVIGTTPPQSVVYIAEGYATAASVYEATGHSAVVALNAGNLSAVATALREKLPASCEIVIVADNDASGVGQKAAQEAASLCGGRVIIPPQTGDANDYVNAGGDLSALLCPPKSEWLIAADDFCAKPAPIQWLVKGWLQRGGLAMVFGGSGVGKTFLVLDWILRIASNVDSWAGYKIRHGGVVYLAGEGHHGLKSRIAGWKKFYSVKKLNAWISSSGCDLNTPEGLSRTIAEIRATGAEDISVIVVDTLHRFLLGDENKAVDVKTMLDACSQLSQTFNAAVILVHHTGASIDAKTRARGSTAWLGALDTQMLVSTEQDKIKIEQMKNKDAELTQPLYFTRTPVSLPGWYDEDGEPVSTIVLEQTVVDETPPLTKTQQLGLNAFRAAIREYGQLDAMSRRAELDVEKWREVFYEMCGDEMKLDTKKKNFQNARRELVESGDLICEDGKYCYGEDYELEAAQIRKELLRKK